jgi:hypothetical protein
VWWCLPAYAWDVIGPDGQPTGRVIEATSMFTAEAPDARLLDLGTDPAALAAAARAADEWLAAHPGAPTTGALAELGVDRKSTRLNSSHNPASRMPSSA